MHIALQGLLVGIGVALAIFALDFLVLRSHAAERAKRLHRTPHFDDIERRRMVTLARFLFFVPPAFALFFWLVWG